MTAAALLRLAWNLAGGAHPHCMLFSLSKLSAVPHGAVPLVCSYR